MNSEIFYKAEKTWNLSKLYSDIDLLQDYFPEILPLKSRIKSILLKLLSGYNFQDIYKYIPELTESKINELIWQLHEVIRKLTNNPLNDTQSPDDIITWLEKAGYKKNSSPQRYDWDIAPDINTFYGYVKEQKLLKEWLKNALRIITIWGRKGFGKTSLASKVLKENKDKFEVIIWRSLLHNPSFDELITEIIQFISPEQCQHLPKDSYKLNSLFIKSLKEHKCLVILDDWEAMLNQKDSQLYGELLQKIGEIDHQSCLVIISDEKPEEIDQLESDLVGFLPLKGLGESATEILKAQGLSDKHLWQKLITLYEGSPLIISNVARTIKQQHGGSISTFLQTGTFVIPRGCHQQLEQQLNSLPPVELQILKILATLPHLCQLGLREKIGNTKTSITQAISNLINKALIEYVIVEDKSCLTVPTLVREQILRQYRLKNTLVNQPPSKPIPHPSQQPEHKDITPSTPTTVVDKTNIVSTNEHETLPSFQEDEGVRPISRWMKFGGVAVGMTVIATVIIAAFTPYNVTVKGKGNVRPVGELPRVEPKISGVITEIKVKEHDKVKKGDTLAIIDDSQLQTKKRQLESTFTQLKIQIQQLTNQVQNQERRITSEKSRQESAIQEAKSEHRRQKRNYEDKKITTKARVDEARANFEQAQHDKDKAIADLKSAQATLQSAQTTLESAKARYDRYLKAKDGLSKNQLEEARLEVKKQESAVITAQSQVEAQKRIINSREKAVESAKERLRVAQTSLNPSYEEVRIAEKRIKQQEAALVANIANLNREKQGLLQQQTEINKQIETTRLELEKVAKDLDKTVIRAIDDGTIFQQTIRNTGVTVQPGETVFTIVPNNAPLEIKAAVATQDRSYLEEGAEVYMRVSACPYPDYGTLKGEVIHIAKDTTKIEGNQTTNTASLKGSVSNAFYEVTITPESLEIGQENNKCSIELGLEGNVDIIAKKETFLSFFLRKARLIADL